MNKKGEDNLSFFDKFIILYKNVPGFNGIVKLALYFIFFAVMIGILLLLGVLSKNGKKDNPKSEVNYQQVLEKVLDHSEYTANVTINDNKYIVTGSFGNNILTGTIESSNGITKYKIKDNNIYEIKMDEEISNEQLFGEMDYKILFNNDLVNIIKGAAGIKIDGETIIYKYENVNISGISYNIELSISNNKITNIKVFNDTCTYDINYN